MSPRSSNLVVAQHSNNNSLSPAGSGTTGSPTVRAASSNDSTTAKYQPRVPSSLRYATGSVVFADADGDNVDDASGSVLRQPQHDSTRTRSPVSSTGTFVVRSNPTTARDGEGEGNEQLQAAVRALQGPSAGLGAVEQVEDGELELPSRSPKKGKDKLGGLMKLFEPPSPPAASGEWATVRMTAMNQAIDRYRAAQLYLRRPYRRRRLTNSISRRQSQALARPGSRCLTLRQPIRPHRSQDLNRKIWTKRLRGQWRVTRQRLRSKSDICTAQSSTPKRKHSHRRNCTHLEMSLTPGHSLPRLRKGHLSLQAMLSRPARHSSCSNFNTTRSLAIILLHSLTKSTSSELGRWAALE